MHERTSRATGESHCLPFERYAVEASCATDRGRVRPTNQDSVCAVVPASRDVLNRRGALIVVADGMGGHQGGELASRMAVERVRESYYASCAGSQQALTEAFLKANREVFERARRDPHLAGMGTTCTAVAVLHGLAWLAHVGDSRMYLVRDASAYRMTQDHSATMELVNRGLLTLAEANRHEERNVILRALGTHDQLDVAAWKDPFPLNPGDRLVLCSDGLYEVVGDDEIAGVCERRQTSEQACRELLRLALERDGTDNITVAVLCIASEAKEVG